MSAHSCIGIKKGIFSPRPTAPLVYLYNSYILRTTNFYIREPHTLDNAAGARCLIWREALDILQHLAARPTIFGPPKPGSVPKKGQARIKKKREKETEREREGGKKKGEVHGKKQCRKRKEKKRRKYGPPC